MLPTNLSSVAVEAQRDVLGVSPAVAPDIKLTFPPNDPDATRTITVGCLEIANPNLKGGPGTYGAYWAGLGGMVTGRASRRPPEF